MPRRAASVPHGALPQAEVDALTTFGLCFGMLFQLRDDVLDVIGTEEDLGKLPGRTWPRASTHCRC